MYVFHYNIMNLPSVIVGIGVLVTVEVTRELIGVYDSVVIPSG